MTDATSLYRAVMLEVERHRIAAGWPSHELDDRAGTQDGFFQKALHPDTKSGRQAQWATVQLFVDALMPEGFEVIIRRKKGASLTAAQASQKIRFIRAPHDRKTQRELMREIGRLGASKGGRKRAAKLGKRARRRIAKLAAHARWRKAIEKRGAEIAADIEKATRRMRK